MAREHSFVKTFHAHARTYAHVENAIRTGSALVSFSVLLCISSLRSPRERSNRRNFANNDNIIVGKIYNVSFLTTFGMQNFILLYYYFLYIFLFLLFLLFSILSVTVYSQYLSKDSFIEIMAIRFIVF